MRKSIPCSIVQIGINISIKNILNILAQEAFTKIGKLLQNLRKQDLYEMVQYYTSNQRDPAQEDPVLKGKLDENHRNYSNRIDEVIDKYV